MRYRLQPSFFLVIIFGLSVPLSPVRFAEKVSHAATTSPRIWPKEAGSEQAGLVAANVALTVVGKPPPGFGNSVPAPLTQTSVLTHSLWTFDGAAGNKGIGTTNGTLSLLASVSSGGPGDRADPVDSFISDPNGPVPQLQPTDNHTATVQLFLPLLFGGVSPDCPITASTGYEIIPIDGAPTDRPDYLHGDLNLSLRGYVPVNADKTLQDINGSTDPNAPQLAGLFNPNQFPGISAVYRVNSWDWSCGSNGCPGPPITVPEVTLIDLLTSPGQPVFIPERSPAIFGDYKAMVLYAEAGRITLGYTRKDSVAFGYAVHLENVCVDPRLLALYREQVGPDGYRIFKNGSYWLPALRNDQALGTALGGGLGVAIRDVGTFLDPRSRKDWWVGY
jgi:hypothetical protein